MKFKHGTRRRALEYEKDWAKAWKKDKTFEKSVKNRSSDNAYVFYDGPPFITGVPHHGTLLSSIVKDAVPRYWTMKGKRVERVWGWDTHGLPAENFVEKQLNITDRRQIVTNADDPAPLDKDGNPLERISLETYITKARESMVANAATWENVIDRIGRWVDFKGAYKTMDKDYMESVWWAFKELYEKGKIYEGEKVLMYDTKFATPVSKNEVTMDNDAYQTVTDPSVYVKFKLKSGYKKDIAISRDSRVLFVCYANVARSQMAKAVFNYLTGTQNAQSAGVGVKDVHPEGTTIGKRNIIVAKEIGKDTYESSGEGVLRDSYNIDITDWPRTQLTQRMLSEYDLVVNIAEEFQTPDWLRGENVVWWGIKDPGLVKDGVERAEASKNAILKIESRIKGLLNGDVIDDDIDSKSYLLAWTTTPSTLPGNTALAVNKDFDYVEVELDGEKLIVAKDLAPKVFVDDRKQPLEYKVLREMKGSELVGLSYEPLFADHNKQTSNNDVSNLSQTKVIILHGTGSSPDSNWFPWLKTELEKRGVEVFAPQFPIDDEQNLENWNKSFVEQLPFELDSDTILIGHSNGAAYMLNLLNDERTEPVKASICVSGFYEELPDPSFKKYVDSFIDQKFDWNTIQKNAGKVVQFHGSDDPYVPLEQARQLAKNLDAQLTIKEKGGHLNADSGYTEFSDLLGEILSVHERYISVTTENENAHKIWSADYVSAENGTGIVHIAPAYGEDDFELAKANNIPVIHTLDDNGYYFPEVVKKLYELMPWVDATKPLEVWENNKNIAKGLEKAGIVWKTEYIRHEYPFNPRSKQRIMYRAIPSWFFDVQGSKPLMLEQNQNINWFPEHLKHGRFAKNIEQAPDWNLSRDRFWATAMPVWKGDKGTVKVVGSYAELKELSGVELEDYHRPWVDGITFDINGEYFTRIDKVLDCWFESGSMPFAQLHYPFENKEKFEKNYPADFIVEYVGQVRAWFYYVHAVNTSLADIGAFGDTEEDQQKTEIVFVRHGQTDANLKVMQGVELTGEDDAPLNETGEKQAQKTAEDLADEQFDVILTSPYKRAIQTAEILNQKHNLEIVVENDLHERIGGNTAMTGEQWHDSFNFDTEVDFDGESVKEFFTRIYRTIEKINRKYAGKKILIVSHGGVQHGFYAYFNKLDWQGNLRIDRIKNAEYRRYSSTCETPKNAFKNVITTGVVAGNDGRKMSKSLGNFTNPNELMNKFSADSLRFLLLSSPLLNGEDFALHDKDVGDVARKLSMIWNMYDFFTMYAEVDGWEFNGELKDPLENLTNPLDIWIVSRLHRLVAEVERNMDVYNIPDAISPILPFLDDASNWYVRRSRRRFWKSEDDSDKSDAYQTLHYVLTRLSYILAPFTPFLAEELYHNMTGDKESIHLKDWLPAGRVNSKVVDDMARTRELINTGLGLRMKKDENQDSIKVRQPLQFASYAGKKLDDYYEQIMAEELNVKEIHWIENLDKHLADYDQTEGKIEPETWLEISKKLTPELKREGLSREVIRFVQSARKKAGLNVDDRIVLSLETDDNQLRQAIEDFRQIITSETLADRFENLEDSYQETVKIDNVELKISLKKS